MMELSCHCGKIKISVLQKPETLTSCNCSICNRYGSLWGYYGPSDVEVISVASALTSYSWSEKNIQFKHCSQCGCVTHYETTEQVQTAKIGVNFRMAAPAEIGNMRIRQFDGAHSWQYLD